MIQFILDWDNTEVLANVNAISQIAGYRAKSIGGAFITAGFTPTNDLAKSAVTTDSPVLNENVVYEFQILTLCTLGGPTPNDNGIIEALVFLCLIPTLSHTYQSAGASVDLTGTDITKVEFSLKRTSDNVIIAGPTVVPRTANIAVMPTVTTVVASTNYYWQLKLYATVNNIELISNVCGNYPFTTEANPVCDPITAATITSIQI